MGRKHDRKAKHPGMVAAPLVCLCSHCGEAKPSEQIYNDWCVSCVMHWGHPDDAAELLSNTRLHGWTTESALAFISDVVPRSVQVAPIILAIQSFGVLDFSSDEKYGKGSVQTTRRDGVAGDGFIFDDDYRSGGRLSSAASAAFRDATLKLFVAGFPNRAISRATGLVKATIADWRRSYEPRVFTCECGDIATHQGWCGARFRASRKRQQFMSRWHPSMVFECVPRDAIAMAWAPEN